MGPNDTPQHVIDFTYIKPTDKDRPYFKFGGMSEFQLIYNEIICDGIVQRAGASFIEKSSSLIYKMKNYARLLSTRSGIACK